MAAKNVDDKEIENEVLKADESAEATEVSETPIKPKRKRRTKAEMEAARAAAAEAGVEEKPKKKAVKKATTEETQEDDVENEALSEEELLNGILAKARKNGNSTDYNEINEFFKGSDFAVENFDKILDFLEKNNIEVKITEEIEDEDEDPLLDDENEEEVDLRKIDMTVPDGIGVDDPVRMYLKEIGQVSLLTAAQEIEYAKKMEKGVIAGILVNDVEVDPEVKIDEETYDELKDKTEKELRMIIADGNYAKNCLAEANLRLVVSIAKRYVGRGMQFLDLIQEGNLGLIKAVEKFDYRKGYKFSTYATWWIRQAITRAIADQARTIRIPVHMIETINKQVRISRQLLQELGREPTPEEIAEQMDVPVERVREIQKISQDPVSLETPIGEEEDSHLGDFIQDEDIEQPSEAAARTLLKEQINEELATLTEREQKVLRLRFGLDDGRARTLEEVGKEFQVTRERIRQIEAKAIRKLRQPSRKKKLQDYLD